MWAMLQTSISGQAIVLDLVDFSRPCQMSRHSHLSALPFRKFLWSYTMGKGMGMGSAKGWGKGWGSGRGRGGLSMKQRLMWAAFKKKFCCCCA
eukprot:g31145.t1